MKKFKTIQYILVSILLISFSAACSSDDDAPGTPDPETGVKVKEFKRINHNTDIIINGLENSLIFDYDANGRVNRITNKIVHQNPADNYSDVHTLNYDANGRIQSVSLFDGEENENYIITFGYDGNRLSSLIHPDGNLEISYNSSGNYYSYQIDPELPVYQLLFSPNGDVLEYTSMFLGTQRVTTNSNSGAYVNTPLNEELKVYMAIMGDLSDSGYFLANELTQIQVSGQTIFGPIEGTITNQVVNVVRNSAGLIQSYAFAEGDTSFEITYTD